MEHNGKQIYPPSITGKGAGFASGVSVLEHTFGQSDPYTLGVDEEYMLLDGETFDLVQAVLGIGTRVCHTRAEVAEQLREIRGYVCGTAREQGMGVGSAGTHPF